MHRKLVYKIITAFDFWTKQDEFIISDLNKCNKSACILPDYRAQQLTRMLHETGMHSDVGVTEYLKARLQFRFEGLVSSSILKKASMVSITGLLRWWSDLNYRTDLE